MKDDTAPTPAPQPPIQIDVFSDPICPWCYIGKKRLDEVVALRPNVPIEIRWRAFQLNPDMPTIGMERRAYLNAKFGGAERADQVYGHIKQVGQDVGIDFRFDAIPRTPNTIDAHRLIRKAQEAGRQVAEAVVSRLFRAYFLDGVDIGDTEALIAVAADAGMDTDALRTYLESNEDRKEVQAEDVFGRRLGINGVPCFIVAGKYALSGAQEPEAFLPLIDMAVEEARKAAAE